MASFLIDECVPRRVHEALKNDGFEIFLVRDVLPGADDDDVLHLAYAQNRILVTEDRRFGLLAMSSGISPSAGVVIISMGNAAPEEKAQRVRAVVPTLLDSISNSVTVIGRNRIRRRSL